MLVMQGLTSGWFNGVDPFEALSVEETVKEFKERYAKGGYMESLLEKYLLNKNTLTFTMAPDKDHPKRLAEEEAARLSREIEKLGGESEARVPLTKQEAELAEIQEKAKKQDLSCLPTLKVEDIPRTMDKKEYHFGDVGGVPVQWRIAPTNGLTYFRGQSSQYSLEQRVSKGGKGLQGRLIIVKQLSVVSKIFPRS